MMSIPMVRDDIRNKERPLPMNHVTLPRRADHPGSSLALNFEKKDLGRAASHEVVLFDKYASMHDRNIERAFPSFIVSCPSILEVLGLKQF
jgi:hypothetical protein